MIDIIYQPKCLELNHINNDKNMKAKNENKTKQVGLLTTLHRSVQITLSMDE